MFIFANVSDMNVAKNNDHGYSLNTFFFSSRTVSRSTERTLVIESEEADVGGRHKKSSWEGLFFAFVKHQLADRQ